MKTRLEELKNKLLDERIEIHDGDLYSDIHNLLNELIEAQTAKGGQNEPQVKQLLAEAIELIKPFADAFEKHKTTNLTDDVKFQNFLDSNQITPSDNITCGNFRLLWNFYNKVSKQSV